MDRYDVYAAQAHAKVVGLRIKHWLSHRTDPVPMKKILAVILILVLVVAVGLVLYVRSVDFNQYRGLIAQTVEEATGRKFVIGGELDVGISLRPRLQAKDVSFANAPWGSEPQMLKIGALQARIALLPLLAGRLQLDRIMLDDATLLLERDALGRGNWVLTQGREVRESEGEKTGLLPEIGSIELHNVKLVWRDAPSANGRVLRLERATLGADHHEGPMHYELVGSFNEEPFSIAGQLASYADLITGRPLRLKLTTEAAGSRLALEGSLKEPLTGRGLDLAFEGAGADLSSLSRLLGRSLPATAPWKLSGRLADIDAGIAVSGLEASLGANDLTGEGRLIRQQGRVLIEGEFVSEHLDLRPFLRGSRGANKPARKRAGHKVFSHKPLPLAGLGLLDASIRYRAGEVITHKLELLDVQMQMRLDQGRLSLEPLEIGLAGSRIRGALKLDAAADRPTLAVKLNARGLDLGALLKRTLGSEPLSGKTNFALDLRGSGSSLAAIMASLEGNTSVLVGKGRARTQKVDQIVGGLGSLLGTLVAKNRSSAVLNCLASDFKIRRGVADSRLLVVDTEVSTLSGAGSVDLGAETLDLVVKPTPKSTTLSVAVPVEIGGTLANPSFTPAKFAALRKLAGVAALATGAGTLPVLIGLGETGAEVDNPCLHIASGKAPAGAQKAGRQKGVTGTLKDLGGKLKGLFSR